MQCIRVDKTTVRIRGDRPTMDHVYGLIKAVSRNGAHPPGIEAKSTDAGETLTLDCETVGQADTMEDVGSYAKRLSRD